MKKRILGVAFGAALLVVGFALNTQNAEAKKDAIGDGNGSCTVSSNCFSMGTVMGSVSCTGTTCSRGFEYVKCDGKRTDC